MYLLRIISHKFTLIALLAVSVASTPSWANLVANGGFETGDFSSWTANTSTGAPWHVASGPAFAGTYFASDGCVGAQCISGTAAQQSSLAQTLATTAGNTYTLTFEFNTGGNGAPNEFDVLWDGTSVLDLGPGGTLGVVGSSGVYTMYTVSGLVGTGSDTLTFLGRQDPGYDQLDNVDVELSGTSSVTPEPATWLLMGGLLPLVYLEARRRRTVK